MVIRRLASLLLVVALGFSSVSLCPQGDCPMVKKAHDCCEKGPGFNAPDCCPDDAAARTAPWLVSSGAAGHDALAVRLVVAPLVLPQPPGPIAAFRTVARHSGLAPPGTLIAQHTSLLL